MYSAVIARMCDAPAEIGSHRELPPADCQVACGVSKNHDICLFNL